MNADNRMLNWLLRLYLLAFFIYLFLPLVVMGAATFNDSRFPTITPWLGTTGKWFEALFADAGMWAALRTSVLVALGVIALSLPVGVSAALLLNALQGRARTVLYGVMVSPLLTPGVIIGISMLVFWNRHFGLTGGFTMMIFAQSCFIAAYVMLMVTARLQRFDTTLEEAALNLGASHWQVFRRILLPFLSPTLISASLLAFLQSFENYNTTLFVRGIDTTLTVYIASKVRTGVTPAVNALGLLLIGITVLAAIIWEVRRRSKQAR